MSEAWQLCQLGDLIDIKHGYAFKGEFFRDEPPGNILLTPGNFAIGGGFQSGNFKYYDGFVPDEYVLHNGDLLVTMTDLSKAGDTLGYSAFVPQSPSGTRFLHNQRLGKVEIHPDAPVDKLFLNYVLRTREYRQEILASATGSSVRHTSPSRIKAYEFYLPPLAEQREIARVLAALDDKIELSRQMNATLEATARAIFKSWFVDFDPVSAKANGEQPVGMDAETAALFPASFEDSELGLIPAGWRVSTIGEEVSVVGGSTPSTKEPLFWDGGTIAWATPKDLSNLASPVLLSTGYLITNEGLAQISSRLLPRGTVLLSSRAPVGYLAISAIPVAINQGFIAMICERQLPNFYVLLWAEINMEAIKGRANGTTFMEVSKSNFRPLPILVPPEKLLREFILKVEPLFADVENNLRQSCTLVELRDALLPRLISGQIRVTEERIED